MSFRFLTTEWNWNWTKFVLNGVIDSTGQGSCSLVFLADVPASTLTTWKLHYLFLPPGWCCRVLQRRAKLTSAAEFHSSVSHFAFLNDTRCFPQQTVHYPPTFPHKVIHIQNKAQCTRARFDCPFPANAIGRRIFCRCSSFSGQFGVQ